MRTFLSFCTMMLALSGCAVVPALNTGTGNLPPVMTLEELHQPYSKLGRIQVRRTVYGADYDVSNNLHEWGLDALRTEAGKLNADAVILPEISSRELTIFVFPAFPATEYQATGVAIKFER